MDATHEKVMPIPESGCWVWVGTTDADGYGRIYYDGGTRRAHRVFYSAANGPIPVGGQIDHLCRVRCCVNPAHMEVVSHAENVARGIGPTAINARKTHCVNGHALTPENTYIWRDKMRQCRRCNANTAAGRKRTA